MALGDPDDARTHTELIALQGLACSDIAFFKNQQWQAAYYGLLLFAAIAALPRAISGIGQIGLIVLWFVALIVLVKGIYVLNELESALRKRRDILPFVRRHFTNVSLTAYGLGSPDEALKVADEKVSLRNVFVFVYLLGFVLTTWVLASGCINT
ncbi:MAG: hypothetical protein AB7P08_17605 [Burkholderiales bacterium]